MGGMSPAHLDSLDEIEAEPGEFGTTTPTLPSPPALCPRLTAPSPYVFLPLVTGEEVLQT